MELYNFKDGFIQVLESSSFRGKGFFVSLPSMNLNPFKSGVLTPLTILLCFFCELTGEKEQMIKPVHHTDYGFKNNYLPEERMSKSLGTVFKWRFTRNSQEKVRFESVEPDIEFLKSNRTEETLTWVGHSTFLWQFGGINLITDPHLTDRASPVGFAGPKRIIEPAIALDDLPELDVVVISHNHYDHLDKKSVLGITEIQKDNPPLFLVPLGMKEVLKKRWWSWTGGSLMKWVNGSIMPYLFSTGVDAGYSIPMRCFGVDGWWKHPGNAYFLPEILDIPKILRILVSDFYKWISPLSPSALMHHDGL
jgi:hypothetical protein